MELCRDMWDKEGYLEFTAYLESCREAEFAAFHSKLNPGSNNILGIRSPKLRMIAKEILKGDACSFLEVVGDTYNEESMIRGMVIGGLKEKVVPFEQILVYIRKMIPYITNWSICDTFCSSLKVTNKHKEEMFEFLRPYAVSNKEYEARFAFVMYLSYYVEPEYLKEVFHYCDLCTLTDYYVQMAIAWLISVCYVKEKEQTLSYLSENKLDDFTYNKALQKMVESFRVPEEEKLILKKRKRK